MKVTLTAEFESLSEMQDWIFKESVLISTGKKEENLEPPTYVPPEVKPKRKRRTKAEIAADQRKEKEEKIRKFEEEVPPDDTDRIREFTKHIKENPEAALKILDRYNVDRFSNATAEVQEMILGDLKSPTEDIPI